MEISQEEYDEITKNQIKVKFLLQEINDNLSGGLTSRNFASFRNTYVINAQDSLDSSYPMYVHFNIIDEMIKIVSVKVEFWILNYRAYSKAGVAQSTPSGGGATSGGQGSASGGGATSGAGGAITPTSSSENQFRTIPIVVGNVISHDGGWIISAYSQNLQVAAYNHTHTVTIPNHYHSTPNHTHPNHTHSTPNHTHPNHSHNAVYGIFEEDTSPTIKFYVSESAGVKYSDVFGGYTTDKSALDITSWITSKGSKLIKFTSTTRTRLSIQITIKLDIKAR